MEKYYIESSCCHSTTTKSSKIIQPSLCQWCNCGLVVDMRLGVGRCHCPCYVFLSGHIISCMFLWMDRCCPLFESNGQHRSIVLQLNLPCRNCLPVLTGRGKTTWFCIYVIRLWKFSAVQVCISTPLLVQFFIFCSGEKDFVYICSYL